MYVKFRVSFWGNNKVHFAEIFFTYDARSKLVEEGPGKGANNFHFPRHRYMQNACCKLSGESHNLGDLDVDSWVVLKYT